MKETTAKLRPMRPTGLRPLRPINRQDQERDHDMSDDQNSIVSVNTTLSPDQSLLMWAGWVGIQLSHWQENTRLWILEITNYEMCKYKYRQTPLAVGVSESMVHPVLPNSPNAETALYSHNFQIAQTAPVSDSQILRISRPGWVADDPPGNRQTTDRQTSRQTNRKKNLEQGPPTQRAQE